MDRTPECVKHCFASCCRGLAYKKMTLTEAEVYGRRNVLVRVDKFPDADGQFLFARENTCSSLKGNFACGDHEGWRLRICIDLTPGSPGCLYRRYHYPQFVREETFLDMEYKRYKEEQ